MGARRKRQNKAVAEAVQGAELPKEEVDWDSNPKKASNGLRDGLFVYGVGRHLADMLAWHPDLKERIVRIFDKDPGKAGTPAPGIGIPIELPEALRDLPSGTRIAVAAILYYEEIQRELMRINPGLICENIDYTYLRLPKMVQDIPKAVPRPVLKQNGGAEMQGAPLKNPARRMENETNRKLTSFQRLYLRGREATARWRQRILLECAGCRHIFWGVRGPRAEFLRHRFQPMLQPGDLFIESDSTLCGRMVDGLPICLPEVLSELEGRMLILVLCGDYPQIRERLTGYGYVENVDFVEGRMLLGEDECGRFDSTDLKKFES